MSCVYCHITNLENLIYENDSYLVLLNNQDQSYLGRCVIFIKPHREQLSELSDKEWLDFKEMLKVIELAFRKAFGATLFNWSCLVNNSYRKKPYTPHIHWHMRPRYDHEIVFEGHTFKDPEFREHYDRLKKEFVSTELQQKIVAKVKSNITS